jgi:DNA-binding transcriptional LysR family regulator
MPVQPPATTNRTPSGSGEQLAGENSRHQDLAGIQAAVAAGMGLSILSEIAIQADHRVLTAKDGFAPIDKTEVALVASPDASLATLRLAEFCDNVQAKAA